MLSPTDADAPMHVGRLYRHPVKAMLGEAVDAFFVEEQGVENARRLALIDEATGRVASGKQARLWRAILTCRASVGAGRVSIHLPDGVTVAAEADEVDARLSELLARQVHAVTTATLERIGTEAERYRPNLVIATPPGYPAYAENEWTGRILEVGQARLRGLGPTPRCVVPTLEHGHRVEYLTPCAPRPPKPVCRTRHGDSAVRRGLLRGRHGGHHPYRGPSRSPGALSRWHELPMCPCETRNDIRSNTGDSRSLLCRAEESSTPRGHRNRCDHQCAWER